MNRKRKANNEDLTGSDKEGGLESNAEMYTDQESDEDQEIEEKNQEESNVGHSDGDISEDEENKENKESEQSDADPSKDNYWPQKRCRVDHNHSRSCTERSKVSPG